MDKEFAAGAVIFRREGGLILFLLLYSGRNGIWGYPKGHLEAGETEEEAAVREIFEETGLRNVKFVPGFRREDVYPAASTREGSRGVIIEKHSVYFLAETAETAIAVDNDEITSFRWATLEEALPLLSFESMREVLRKAKIVIRGK